MFGIFSSSDETLSRQKRFDETPYEDVMWICPNSGRQTSDRSASLTLEMPRGIVHLTPFLLLCDTETRAIPTTAEGKNGITQSGIHHSYYHRGSSLYKLLLRPLSTAGNAYTTCPSRHSAIRRAFTEYRSDSNGFCPAPTRRHI
jgi:hypothetical protein